MFCNKLFQLIIRYDNLFETSFPYSAGMHLAPVNDGEHAAWHGHMHFIRRCCGVPHKKNYMVKDSWQWEMKLYKLFR